MATVGFGPLDLASIKINGNPLTQEYQDAIINMYIQRSIMGASTVTLQLADPYRKLLTSLVKQGATLELVNADKPDTSFKYILVQFMKASDQMQLVFESRAVYRLSHQTGQLKVVGTDTTVFMQQMAGALGYRVVGPDYSTIWPKITTKPIYKLNMSRGSTADPNENSWVAMNRLASSIGWRLWEDDEKIYFGPDEYWLGLVSGPGGTPGSPPINHAKGKSGKNMSVLKEFTNSIQLIDFDWDVGKPFGMANVTCLLDGFDYHLGEVVKLDDSMGPASGYWLVYGIQRDLFNPQATLTLQAPMPIGAYIDPTSMPMKGLPLQPLNSSLLK